MEYSIRRITAVLVYAALFACGIFLVVVAAPGIVIAARNVNERTLAWSLGLFLGAWLVLAAARHLLSLLVPNATGKDSRWLTVSIQTMKWSAGALALTIWGAVVVPPLFYLWPLPAIIFCVAATSATAAGIRDVMRLD